MNYEKDLEILRPLMKTRKLKNTENNMCINKQHLGEKTSLELPTIPKLEIGGVFNAVNYHIF